MGLKETFIANMRRIRREKNITQEQLAEFCETDTAYIGQIETNKRFPSINMIEKIAAALKVDASELFKQSSENGSNSHAELLSKIKEILVPEIQQQIQKEFSTIKQ